MATNVSNNPSALLASDNPLDIGASGNADLSWIQNLFSGDQSTPSVTAPGSPGNLSGSTYEGQFGNIVSSLPVLGGVAGGILSGLFGSKPAVPNPTSTASSAITGDISNLGNESQLAQGTTQINAQDAALPYEMNLPGYNQDLNQASTNTSQELSGQLPKDVQNLIQTQAAERGISTGQGAGSPDTNSTLLADLGLTSLGEEQTGQQNLSQLIGETPTGQSFNTQSDQVTPEQEQAAQLLSNEVAASPDPILAGLLGLVTGSGGGGDGGGGGGGIGAIAGLL